MSDDRASREVLRGDAVHPDGAHLDAVAPVELDHVAADLPDQVGHAEPGDEPRAAACEGLDGR